MDVEPVVPCSPKRVSTKGSCVAPNPSGEDNYTDISDQCELYVDVDPPHLVAIGKVYNLGSTIHHKTIEDDNVRVAVEEVRDADALVPLPTDEVQKVGQAPNHFIQWPRRLVKSISAKATERSSKDVPHKDDPHKDDPLECLFMVASKIGKDPVKLPWDPDVPSRPSTMPFYIHRMDILEVYMGKEMLNISVIQLWLMYLHRLCINEKKNEDIYGFMDPQSIQSVGNKALEVQSYLQSRLHQGKKECYLAPYLHSNHWQLLIICPKQNVVVVLCSLHKKTINKEMKTLVDSAMGEYQRLVGLKSGSRRKLTWIFPHCQTQFGNYECGYYVMRHMLIVVTLDILDSWKEFFNDPGPIPEEEIANIQQRWATFFLQISNL